MTAVEDGLLLMTRRVGEGEGGIAGFGLTSAPWAAFVPLSAFAPTFPVILSPPALSPIPFRPATLSIATTHPATFANPAKPPSKSCLSNTSAGGTPNVTAAAMKFAMFVTRAEDVADGSGRGMMAGERMFRNLGMEVLFLSFESIGDKKTHWHNTYPSFNASPKILLVLSSATPPASPPSPPLFNILSNRTKPRMRASTASQASLDNIGGDFVSVPGYAALPAESAILRLVLAVPSASGLPISALPAAVPADVR